MKKKIIATITMLCLLTVLYNYLRLPDYHITNSISFSSADTRNTELTVIVYKCWEIDGVIKDIENEHNKINGTPTTLEINLYYPTYYFHVLHPLKISCLLLNSSFICHLNEPY